MEVQTPISEVYNIDCMEYMGTIEDKFFDLCIADPPYRSSKENAPQYEMRAKGDFSTFGEKPTQEMFDEIKRVSKHQIVFGANNYGYQFKGFIAWDKGVRGSDRYSQVELASVSDGLGTTSKLCQLDCHDKKGKIHPTQKPISLYVWILNSYLPKIGGGKIKVFDPFLGSGSSRIACHLLGHDFYGCELSKIYFDAQEARFQQECAGVTITKDKKIVRQTLF